MNSRNLNAIRLGGWCALSLTLIAVAAGAFLAFTFFQAGDVVKGGMAGALTLACAIGGGLLGYGCFLLVALQSTGVSQSETEVSPTPAALAEVDLAADAARSAQPDNGDWEPVDHLAPTDTLEQISLAVTAAPEFSDDAIPVFASTSSTMEHVTAADVMPPAFATSKASVEPVELPTPVRGEDDFDSRFDMPVVADVLDASESPVAESSDDYVSQSTPPAAPIESLLAQTAQIDVLHAEDGLTLDESSGVINGTPSHADVPHLEMTESVLEAHPPVRLSPPEKPAQRPPVERPAAAVVQSPAPAPVDDDPLEMAWELPSVATTLTPTAAVNGALPSEIPDFFLRMPTGRAVPVAKTVPFPAAKPAPPIAAMPVAPLPKQAQRPAPATVVPAAVRIVDSSTPKVDEDDLMTMTSIPDDWPS